MIDPLAGPWTGSRSRQPGRRRIESRSPFSGAGSAGTATVADLDLQTEFELDTDLDLDDDIDIETGDERDDTPGVSSYLDAKPPHLTRPRKSVRARIRARTGNAKRGHGWRRRMAIPLLVLLVAAALALTGIIVGIVNGGNGWASGQAAAESPLVMPAPELAAGLPIQGPPLHNPTAQQLITEFVSRFTSVVGTYSGQPTAIYREPGTIDVATNQPGWLMYLGDNATVSLGAPGVTIKRVMTALTGTSTAGTFWSVAPGPRGGSADCAIARYGSASVSLCAWATGNTIGALMSPLADTRGNELAALMPLMRIDLQPGWPSRRLRTSVG